MEQGLACAKGGAIDGKRCPYEEHEVETAEADEAWNLITSLYGPLRFAGMSGVAVGLDYPAALAVGAARGFDERALSILLPMAEDAIVTAVRESVKSSA